MVINYLIPTKTQCADEAGEKVLIHSQVLYVVTCEGIWAKFFGLDFFFFHKLLDLKVGIVRK